MLLYIVCVVSYLFATMLMLLRYMAVFLMMFVSVQSVSALTPISQKGVPIDRSPNLVWTPPTWFVPHSLATAPTSIDYWMDVLPFAADRYASSQYVVVPTLGLVAPIRFGSAADQKRFLNGQQVDIDPYLRRGVMYYHGTSWIGNQGNAVYFGHSNHYRNDPGRYKTIFGNIMAVDPVVDQLWFYQRQGQSNKYTRFVYRVSQSFETSPSNVKILLPQGGAQVTLIACTDGLNGRWIVKADLISSDVVTANYSWGVLEGAIDNEKGDIVAENEEIVVEEIVIGLDDLVFDQWLVGPVRLPLGVWKDMYVRSYKV